jgi:hypothetical protein
VLGSSFALFRFSKMSLMDLIVPFLLDRQFLMRAYAVLTACVVTYILKFPPTKNWRPMIAVLGVIKLGIKRWWAMGYMEESASVVKVQCGG